MKKTISIAIIVMGLLIVASGCIGNNNSNDIGTNNVDTTGDPFGELMELHYPFTATFQIQKGGDSCVMQLTLDPFASVDVSVDGISDDSSRVMWGCTGRADNSAWYRIEGYGSDMDMGIFEDGSAAIMIGDDLFKGRWE